jgi:hypothetical protein
MIYRDIIQSILDGLKCGLVDNKDSLSLTRALVRLIYPNDQHLSFQSTSQELASALLYVAAGGKKCIASFNFGIRRKTLSRNILYMCDQFNLDHQKEGKKDLQQLCITDSASVKLAVSDLVNNNSGKYTKLVTKDMADVIARLSYLNGRTGLSLIYPFCFKLITTKFDFYYSFFFCFYLSLRFNS